MYRWGGEKAFPTVVTIFSAPNYCDFYNNKGAVIKFKVHIFVFSIISLIFSNSYKTLILTCSPIS
jgi:hypothetical protein